MRIAHAPRHGRRLTVTLAAVCLISALAAVTAHPASAQILVPVPPGCGSYSGTMVLANRLDDHSNDAAPLGNIAGAPHQVPANAAMITVGTILFSDHIQGNAVSEIICGRGGNDWIKGGSGLDEIFGGNDADVVWGEEDGDVLHGGPGRDFLYGDDPANSNGNLDLVDDIHGGDHNDDMFGGAANDTFSGGLGGNDFADGQAGNDICDPDVEAGPC